MACTVKDSGYRYDTHQGKKLENIHGDFAKSRNHLYSTEIYKR